MSGSHHHVECLQLLIQLANEASEVALGAILCDMFRERARSKCVRRRVQPSSREAEEQSRCIIVLGARDAKEAKHARGSLSVALSKYVCACSRVMKSCDMTTCRKSWCAFGSGAMAVPSFAFGASQQLRLSDKFSCG